MKPMTAEDAALHMDMLHHDFYVFRNEADDEVNVVYRRHDGDYGLIVPVGGAMNGSGARAGCAASGGPRHRLRRPSGRRGADGFSRASPAAGGAPGCIGPRPGARSRPPGPREARRRRAPALRLTTAVPPIPEPP